MSRIGVVGIVGFIVVFKAPHFAQAQSGFEPFLGVSGVMSQVPQPFAGSCLLVNGLAGGVGAQLAIGARLSPRFDVQTRYTTSNNSHYPCAFADGDAIATVRTKAYEVEGTGLQSFDVQAGFSPSPLRLLRISGGFGVELPTSTAYLVGGLGIRLGNRAKFVTGVDIMAFRTRYLMVEDEYRGWERLSRTQLADGYEQKIGWMFRAGAEIPLTRKSR